MFSVGDVVEIVGGDVAEVVEANGTATFGVRVVQVESPLYGQKIYVNAAQLTPRKEMNK